MPLNREHDRHPKGQASNSLRTTRVPAQRSQTHKNREVFGQHI